MDSKKVLATIKNAYLDGYRDFGIRAVHEPVVVGQSLEPSYGWDIENDCQSDEPLNGTCAVGIDTCWLHTYDDIDDDNAVAESIEQAFHRAKEYYGVQIALIASKDGCEYGNDPDEVILPDADVLEVIS